MDPLAARFPKTQKGAEGFARFVIAEVSRAYKSPDPEIVRALVDPTDCPDCSRWLKGLQTMKAAGHRFVGEFIVVDSVSASTVEDQKSAVFTLMGSPKGSLVDRSGRRVKAREATPSVRVNLELEFRKHWVLVRAGLVK